MAERHESALAVEDSPAEHHAELLAAENSVDERLGELLALSNSQPTTTSLRSDGLKQLRTS